MSRAVSYQPMGQKISTTTHEQMQELLAKRCADAQEKHDEQPVEPVLRPTVTWCEPQRTGALAGLQLSECGKYSVDAAKDSGQWRFTAWFRPRECLGCFDVGADAREACEAHLNG